jgi:hypothetical protein
MEMLNQPSAHSIGQLLSSAASMQSRVESLRSSIKGLLLAAGLAAAVAAPAWAAQSPDAVVSQGAGTGSVVAAQDADAAVDPDSVAHANWRALMAQNPTPAEGCFHASYPDIVWQSVDCKIGQPRVRPTHAQPREDQVEVTGNTNDYVAEATGLITLAGGNFAPKGVTSEVGVGVAEYKYQGILGPNEYSIQLNTNARLTTSACAHHSGCTVWQQFVYSPDFLVMGQAAVLMQYWLLGWGSSDCPVGWFKYAADCVTNSATTEAPDLPITDLGKMSLSATAMAGADDEVIFSYGSDSYAVNAKDNVLDISSVWNKAEFNVVGNAGGSRADFNKGSSIAVTVVLLDGSTSAPKCVANDGTTGETNNLNLGSCAAFSGIPYIKFTESN